MSMRIPFRLTVALLLAGVPTAVLATGEFIQEIRFFSRSGMDQTDNLAFFHGRLGILRPTMDDNRLFAAYRQMLGGTFTDAQAKAVLAPCCGVPGSEPFDDVATTTWEAARKRVLTTPPPPPATDGTGRTTGPLDVACIPNAYRNAAATLLQRIKEHGATDASVREWTAGEDAVLTNCTRDWALPAADAPNAPAWLKADRAYQIASAHFYRLEYARAGELYAAIGQDATSPWQKVSRYLAVRAAVHGAIAAMTPESIAGANAAISALASDPQLADYRIDATHLASMLAYATQPGERARALEKTLLAAELPETLAVDLHDLVSLAQTGKRTTDATAWLYDVDGALADKEKRPAYKEDVLARWRASHTLPWLVAAMMFLAPDDPEATEAIAASQMIDASSPAFYTLAWHRLRLTIGAGKADDARSELDRLLAAPTLPEGVGNLLRYQRLAVARNVGEFAQFGVRHGEFIMYLYNPKTMLSAWPLPLPSTKWDNDTTRVLGWRTELFQKDPPFFDGDGAFDMSAFMPLPMMAQVVNAPGLPATIKRDLALAVWTRAVLLDDPATATAMADAVAPFFPQYAADWKAYRGATNPDTRKVEAALLLLKLPGAKPYPDWGLGYIYKRDVIGTFGPRWWGSGETPYGFMDDDGKPLACLDCGLPLPLIRPSFVNQQDEAAAKADNDRLMNLPGAPAYLGAIVIPWAKAHLTDPRVPEALHNVVRATQYGDMDTDTSKAAYNLLHDRFPRNAWTKKTPYWF